MPTECAPVNAMAMKVVVKRRWRKVVRGLSGALCGDEVMEVEGYQHKFTHFPHTDGFIVWIYMQPKYFWNSNLYCNFKPCFY